VIFPEKFLCSTGGIPSSSGDENAINFRIGRDILTVRPNSGCCCTICLSRIVARSLPRSSPWRRGGPSYWQRPKLEPHAQSGIRHAGRGCRSSGHHRVGVLLEMLPRRPLGRRRKDEAFDASRHRSEARGESYKLIRSIGERRQGQCAWSCLVEEAGTRRTPP